MGMAFLGGRDKVNFYKGYKHFSRAYLGRNWRLGFMSTHFDYVIYAGIHNFSYVDLINWIFFVDFKHISKSTT